MVGKKTYQLVSLCACLLSAGHQVVQWVWKTEALLLKLQAKRSWTTILYYVGLVLFDSWTGTADSLS